MISIITPTNNPKYLSDCWKSLQLQTCQDFEWVIVPNNKCGPVGIEGDKIRLVPFNKESKSVGEIKNFAFSQGTGEWLLELDHDDILLPNALEELVKVSADFVYSGAANFKDKTWEPVLYNTAYGWEHRTVTYNGYKLQEHIPFEPTPASLRLIYWAPNHFRAWRREFYHRIGGHNVKLPICDDHELVIRSYLMGSVQLVDKCLYLYRVVGDDWNVWLKRNQDIQEETKRLHSEYMYKLVERWADINKLSKVDLCGSINSPDGYLSVDLCNAAITCDLNDKWPFGDSTVGVIRAFDALEHLENPIHTMKEIHRVLVPNGYLISMTPSTDGRGAFQDPTHVSFWNENSFWYYTKAQQAKYIGTPVRFQTMRLLTGFPSNWHKENKIPYVYADLACLKGDRRLPGLVEI